MTTFSWLPAKDFFEEVFEAKPLHMRNVLPPGYFSMKDLSAALTASMTSVLPFKIGLHGHVPPRHEYCSEVINPFRRQSQIEIDPLKVEALLKRGANLRIQRFATLSEKILAIVSDIESWLGFVTSANGYFSLGNQRALPVHWDSHDVLAVQLIGKKNWKIFNPTVELPLKSHRDQEQRPPGLNSLYMEINLEAGDALYVPRGWWHDVSPIKGEKTLHLAAGLHPPTSSDFLIWVVGQQAMEDTELRRSLVRADAGADLSELLPGLVAPLRSSELLEKYWKQYLASVRPIGTFRLDGAE